jgi:hypothetical protein
LFSWPIVYSHVRCYSNATATVKVLKTWGRLYHKIILLPRIRDLRKMLPNRGTRIIRTRVSPGDEKRIATCDREREWATVSWIPPPRN